jgi:hypothetical protein
MKVRETLVELYRKARADVRYRPQPYARWDAEYARRLSESFGVKITLRAGRSKIRGGTLSITTQDGLTWYHITIYENQPGNLEHEIAHYIQFAVFGKTCLMDKKNYAIEEIKAESTAYVLSVMAGNDSREARSVPYVRKYMREAGVDPESLISDIEDRVAEFLRHGIMPPKYSPIVQGPRFRYGRCGRRLRHVFEMGDECSPRCIRCGQKVHGLLVRMYGEPAPVVA